MTHFLDAIRNGDLATLKNLVTDSYLHTKSWDGETPLHYASRSGHPHIVEYMVMSGSNVNALDDFKRTPIYLAAANNSRRCVQMLIDLGADTSISDDEGKTLLHAAVNSLECVTLILSVHPHDVNSFDGFRNTPLSLAFRTVKRDVIELLLDCGARLDLVKLDDYYLKEIPKWAVSFVARRKACRNACWAILELVKRRSKEIRGNGRDALGLVARAVWALRKNEMW